MKDFLKNIKIITFDLDGTLYPINIELSEDFTNKRIEKIAEVNKWTFEETKLRFEEKIKELTSTTSSMTALGVDGHKFSEKYWNSVDWSKYIDRNNRLIEFFNKLKDKRFAILTNSNTKENIVNKINPIGLSLDIFEFYISSIEFGFNKPDPKIFNELIRRSGCEAREILYVGDKEMIDIIPAKKLGIRTCLVGSESKIADMCIERAEGLLELLI